VLVRRPARRRQSALRPELPAGVAPPQPHIELDGNSRLPSCAVDEALLLVLGL
jgi:hypothetical protein